eukprot:scaffold7257_cov65-Phaeocystis_antarctica.AAC.15
MSSGTSKAATTICQPRPRPMTWWHQLKSISVTPELPKASHAWPPTGTCSSSSSMLELARRCGGSLRRSGRHEGMPSACSSRRTLSDSRTAWSYEVLSPSQSPSDLGAGCLSMAVCTESRACSH